MREILFRGKRIDNGEWVEGFYNEVRHHNDNSHIHPFIMIPEKCVDNQQNLDFWAEVDHSTVGQFTGLTDKNGKKIFDGDIIRSDNGKQSAVSVVKFGEYVPKMFYKMLDMFCPGKKHLPTIGFYAESVDKHEEIILFQSPCVTVIGNIHDNPELPEPPKGD